LRQLFFYIISSPYALRAKGELKDREACQQLGNYVVPKPILLLNHYI